MKATPTCFGCDLQGRSLAAKELESGIGLLQRRPGGKSFDPIQLHCHYSYSTPKYPWLNWATVARASSLAAAGSRVLVAITLLRCRDMLDVLPSMRPLPGALATCRRQRHRRLGETARHPRNAMCCPSPSEVSEKGKGPRTPHREWRGSRSLPPWGEMLPPSHKSGGNPTPVGILFAGWTDGPDRPGSH